MRFLSKMWLDVNGEVAYKETVRCINNACVVDAGGLTELNVDGLIKLICVRSVLSL